MGRLKYTKELLEIKVKESFSLRELMEKLGMNYYSSQKHIRNLLEAYNLNTSHFIGIKIQKRNNEEIFKTDSKVNRSTLRKRIIDNNLIPYICQNCNCNDEWMGKKMPFILDHINGIGEDNRIENLRWLCSNCDSIQDTYKSKNKNSSKSRKRIINKINRESEILNIKLNKHKITELKNNELKQQILNSRVEFNEMGWGVELSKILNMTPQNCLRITKKLLPEFYKEKCWKKFEDKNKFKRQKDLEIEKSKYNLEKIKKNINLIKASKINFKERGCFVKANQILGFKQTTDAIKWLKRNLPELIN